MWKHFACLSQDACGLPAHEAQLRSMGAWLPSDTFSSSLEIGWICPFPSLKLGNFLTLASLILLILLPDKGRNTEYDFLFPKLNSQWPCLILYQSRFLRFPPFPSDTCTLKPCEINFGSVTLGISFHVSLNFFQLISLFFPEGKSLNKMLFCEQ